MIKPDFMDALTAYFAALIADRDAVNDLSAWLSILADPPMLAIGFIGICLLGRKRIRWPETAIILVFAYLIGASALPLGAVTGAMGELLPRLAGQNTAVVVMLFLALTTTILTIMLLVPTWRSRDRFVVMATGWAMLVTTTAFHLIIIHGLMMQGFRLEEERLALATPLPTETHEQLCQNFQWECWEQRAGDPIPEAAGQNAIDLLTLRLKRRPDNLPPGAYFGVSWSNPDITSGGPYAARYQEMPGSTYRLVISRTGIMAPYNAYELLFVGHMALSHSIWLILGLAVIYGHRRVDERRRKPGLTEGITDATS
ncbi:MAG: hypothetical protein KI792_09010 [Alphaproteobacteria bacterium]|nr:hypothetical protein [Alphaproteobacteria bacterium SS10]